MSKLVLGTAQFGDNYGVTNTVGRLDDGVVADMVLTALSGGITMFDTSESYGDAQERLAEHVPSDARPEYVHKFRLHGEPTPDSLFLDASRRLRTHHLFAVLAHHVGDLRDDRFPTALRHLRDARDHGDIDRIGVSVYDAEDVELALSVMPDLDIIQIPGSVVDRRLLDSPLIERLRGNGAEVHVRSAFLQGLLLSEPTALSTRFRQLGPVLTALDHAADVIGAGRLALLLAYLSGHETADAVVVGATSPTELSAILSAWNQRLGLGIPPFNFDLPVEIVDPRLWG